jgi:[amino group carrier protein]-lysine/ornithine hydrolase
VAYRSARDTVLARAFVDAIRAEGMRPAFKHKTGTADFNVVGPVWRCPMVAYGPGDSSLDHTPIEHVDITEFETSVRVLARVLQDTVKQP